LLGRGAAGRDRVSGVLEGLQVLRGVGRHDGGDWRAVPGEVDNLAVNRLADRVGRQLIGVACIAMT
jgi:hypothetical protein